MSGHIEHINKVSTEHINLVVAFFNATLEDRTAILIKLSKVWRELKNLKATGEAHVLAVNHAVSVGKLRKHWYIAR